MSQLHAFARDGGRAVDTVARRIEEISTLPAVALRVMQIAGNENSSAGDLTEAMESDAALSARVLRCVNSAAYGVRRKITNLQQAIAYLGMKQIRNLAMTASVSELFRTEDAIGPYRRSGLWRHLVSTGIGARMIANRVGCGNGEDMFLAGLLHDIGIILEDQHVHVSFRKVIQSLREDATLAAAERNLLTFDHTTLGEKVAETWGFPESIQAAIRYHHMSTHYRGRAVATVRCVEVANIVCAFLGISSVGISLVRFSPPAFAALGLAKEDLPSLMGELEEELSANASLFCV